LFQLQHRKYQGIGKLSKIDVYILTISREAAPVGSMCFFLHTNSM